MQNSKFVLSPFNFWFDRGIWDDNR